MILNSVISVKQKKKVGAHEDKLERSLVKTISWRVIGTIDTIIISWWITGALDFAFSIGAVELISKMILYFFHERAWNSINWGK